MTPEEAWSAQQPDVVCIAFSHVRDQKRTKTISVFFIGVSRESKAYKLYNSDFQLWCSV